MYKLFCYVHTLSTTNLFNPNFILHFWTYSVSVRVVQTTNKQWFMVARWSLLGNWDALFAA